MRPIPKCLSPTLLAALSLAACGSSSSGQASSTQAATATASQSSQGTAVVVKSASNATLRATVLTNASGITLYSLSGEQNGKFICAGSCLQVWHPVAVPAAGTPSGSVGSLGTVKRPDGTEQVTYKGMPLYTFAQDQRPGDAKGQGFKDVGTWKAVTIGASSTPATQTAPSSSTPGYSY